MVLYECIHCNFSSKQKNDFKRHLSTKKHGRNILLSKKTVEESGGESEKRPKKTKNEQKKTKKDQKRPKISKKFACDYCKNMFTTYAHKRRHESYYCKSNDLIKLNKENHTLSILYNEKTKEVEKLEKRVDKLTDKIGDTFYNTTCTNNNIKVNSYGNEDLSHITDEFKTEMLKLPYGAIPKMLEAIHFNDKVPENKNILMPNINKNIVKIKSGDKWVYKNKDEILKDMIDTKYLILDDHYDLVVGGEVLSKFNTTNYLKFKHKLNECDKDLIRNLKSGCELMIMNHRES